MDGVVRTRVGYTGGAKPSPTYHDLGDHSEGFQIDFDPAKVSFDRLLDLVWAGHNPCAGSFSRQYRSIVFWHDDAQRRAIEAGKAKIESTLGRPVKTAILPYEKFWLAEDYHQKYELRNDAPLLKEFRAMFPDDRDFVNSTAAARVNGYLAGDGKPAQLAREIDLLGLSPEGRERLRAHVR